MNAFPRATFVALFVATSTLAQAAITQHPGSDAVLPDKHYIHVVSEKVSPVMQTWIKAKDGVYIASAIRKPKGNGPFPAMIMFHGAPGGRGMEQLVGWSRGDHGGPVWERFLQEGYVVVVADYRGGDGTLMNQPSSTGLVTAIDDGMAVVDYVQNLPYVKRDDVNVYGVSLGGNLAMYLASKIPSLHAVVAGAPAPIWFLGYDTSHGWKIDWATVPPNEDVTKANIETIQAPILLLVGSLDPFVTLDTTLHDRLNKYGKRANLEIYEYGWHDFVLGKQGHVRPDLPHGGEHLMQGTLDALELTVKFVKDPR
jgi:dipeptidyl aminopeptidase/acylaminoacyl peptidase